MRKIYEYLEDNYYEDANSQKQKRKFLSTLDDFVNQKQYVKITLLNWHEDPIKEIAGELTSGTLTKDGSSAVRRTCQLQCSVNGGEYNVEDGEMDFAINKKVFIEIGVKNYTNEYPEYPILYFPQGVFFISSFAITSSATSTVNISLTLKDKMCGLNGEVGGSFQATMILDEQDAQSPSGQYVTEKVLIYNIIQELVHHFGGEDLNNIIIEDVPLRIKRVMKWSGDNPIYLVPISTEDYTWYNVVEENPTDADGVIQVQNGTDAGYVYDDFVYSDDLTANLGENVCTILDKIKSYLGNYEYFYDVFGVFHFREIKNYLNTTQAKTIVEDMNANNYLAEVTDGKTVYSFDDKKNLISLTANPRYGNIKNDYIVQGLRKMTNSDISYAVRYHLSIDKKPKPGNTYYNILSYTEKDTNLVKLAFPLTVDSETQLPMPGNFNLIYRTKDSNKFYYWEDEVYKEVPVISYYPPKSELTTFASEEKIEASIKNGGYTTKDWRTELFLQGLLAKNNGTDSGMYYSNLQSDYNFYLNSTSWLKDIYDQVSRERIDTDYYFEELEAFWPQIYDLDKQEFIGTQENKTLYTESLTDGNFFLDFIEPSTSGLGEFSVSNIGRRTDAVSNEDINCLFQPSIPDIVFLNVDADDFQDMLDECRTKGQPFTQVKGDIYWAFSTGGYKNGAFDQIKYELYQHTTYQKTLSLSALPVFYLEPNSRIKINDASTNTYGDFMLQNISIPLGAGNTMNCTANECLERF